MFLDKEVVDIVSRERSMNPAHIEKDWYAVQVLRVLASFPQDSLSILFSGGTSLSKAHGLLDRFSEDLDFRVRFGGEQPPERATKECFRKNIIKTLDSVDGIGIDEGEIKGGRFGFKIPLSYPKFFDIPAGMRSDLQVDFSYSQPRLESTPQTVASFVNECKGDKPEVHIDCVSPVEIAADKFSGLTWRVIKRDRDDRRDDPFMIRHLHDLCALHDTIVHDSSNFTKQVGLSYAQDQKEPFRQLEMSLAEAAKKALGELRADKEYKEEYQGFVEDMSYADEDKAITFEKALAAFEALAKTIEASS